VLNGEFLYRHGAKSLFVAEKVVLERRKYNDSLNFIFYTLRYVHYIKRQGSSYDG